MILYRKNFTHIGAGEYKPISWVKNKSTSVNEPLPKYLKDLRKGVSKITTDWDKEKGEIRKAGKAAESLIKERAELKKLQSSLDGLSLSLRK